MQLIRFRGSRPKLTVLSSGLAAATCSLLGQGAAQAVEVESAVLTYVEPGRVSVLEAVVQAAKELRNGHRLGFRFVYDALTGASANGATPASHIQTFTRPSGQGTYSVGASKTPLDTTFRDSRYALSGNWKLPLGRLSTGTIGGNFSTEHDYLSVGFSANVTRDFFMRNTTLAAGVSASADRVDPEGGTPTPLSPMIAPTEEEEDDLRRGDEDEDSGPGGPAQNKTVLETLIGISQIVDRHTVAQLNFSVSSLTGYQTDPYKLVSVVADEQSGMPGDPLEYVYEKRPEQRTKRSLYGELRRRIGPDMADASYRYFWDDWGIRSHTWELRYDRQLSDRWNLTPHVRFYRQTAADFYHRFLLEGTSLPDFASADYRLGTMTTTTLGLDFSHAMGNGHQWRVGADYYLQQGDSSPPDAFGVLRDLDLFPSVDALVFRVGYRAQFDF